MAEDGSRRQFLRIAGASAAASLAGCASIADQLPAEKGSAGTATRTGTPVGTATEQAQSTPADDSGSTATEGETEPEWSTESVTIDPPSFSFEDVPVPSGSKYARLGADDATATATLFGNWKCPYTQEFVLNDLPEVVGRYVESGDLQLEFRSVAYLGGEPFLGPDAPRAARAGLGVWHLDPESYWTFFASVFTNQPQERHAWAQPSLLLRFAKAADVSRRKELERRIKGGRYADAVSATTATAADRGVSSVPRIAVDGTLTAPTVDFEATIAQLDDAVRS